MLHPTSLIQLNRKGGNHPMIWPKKVNIPISSICFPGGMRVQNNTRCDGNNQPNCIPHMSENGKKHKEDLSGPVKAKGASVMVRIHQPRHSRKLNMASYFLQR
mmetsp:Transcript_20212/g.40932  ORF Transcript_20212/g.40932 Transcript_20212/m.40932 type:complete len:103 (-) Transcript_20212:134-442(-)